MATPSGFGRGGRGRALLAALANPVRLPNAESPAPGHLPQVSPQARPVGRGFRPVPSVEPTTQTHPPAVGRGFLGSLTSPQAVGSSVDPSPQPTQPVGRARGAMDPSPRPTQPVGRARGIINQSPRPPQPVGQTGAASPKPPQSMGRASLVKQQPQMVRTPHAPGTGAPTSAMASLTIKPLEKQEVRTGVTGIPIDLSANYVLLQARAEGVYQYCVSFDPPIEGRNFRFKLLNEQAELIGPTKAFDGSILYLPRKITDSTITRESRRPTDDTLITMSITLVGMVHHADCLHLFNVIFRRIFRVLEFKQVGRHFYNPHSPIAIPQHKMELWPGYISSIAHYDGGLMLMFDIAHRLLRTDSALDFMYEIYSSHQKNFQEMVTKHLVGCIVLTRYNNRTYRVDDIAWDKNPQCTFVDHAGKAVSFIEYYREAYGKEIGDLEQPLLIHRPRRNAREKQQEETDHVICLVPELCCMTGLTDMARSDFRVMKDIAVHTRVNPSGRELSFKKFIQLINTNPKAKEQLSSWGLQLSPAMLDVEGRKLPVEKILFRKNTVLAGEDADWGRDAVRENVISAVPLRNWLVVVTKRDQNKAMDFITMMKRVGPPMGIEVKDAKVVPLINDRTESYLQAIRPEINPSLQLVVTIFPTMRDDRYAAVKKLCCIENPIPSQAINSRTISQQQKLRSVTQKIALQINCKLGGELWAVEIPLKNLMVIGIDVYHDSVQGKKRSIAGFVSSTNQHLTRWYARVAIQDPKQEIMDGLKLCLQAGLKKYHEDNHTLPDRIIVFRDGVGDGQMRTVAEYEVPQILSCFSEFGETYKPKMAVCVVQKRISTRIFRRGMKGPENPPPGTIVDHTITRAGWYDFFLVSQHVRQGTVTPTHYNVVYDTTGMKPDHMQRLAYKLTHMYYNWPGTIRVPAPCQYAHKLAFLVGQSLHNDPSLKLSDRLFFL